MIGRERQLELLEIVGSFGDVGCSPEQVARIAFPDSPLWEQLPQKPRRGARRGGRIIGATAGLLGQLASDRLVKKSAGRYVLTQGSRGLLARAGINVPGSAPQEDDEMQPKSSEFREATERAPQAAAMQWMPDGAGNSWLWDGTIWHVVDQYGAHYACYAGQWVCVGWMQTSYGSTAANW
jgi:hypothetical protein